MGHNMTSTEWTRIGRTIGHERGQMDRFDRISQRVDDLWIPPGTPEIYAQALKEGYVAGLRGEHVPGGDL